MTFAAKTSTINFSSRGLALGKSAALISSSARSEIWTCCAPPTLKSERSVVFVRGNAAATCLQETAIVTCYWTENDFGSLRSLSRAACVSASLLPHGCSAGKALARRRCGTGTGRSAKPRTTSWLKGAFLMWRVP